MHKRTKKIDTNFLDADYTDFDVANQCGLGSGFLDTSICEACGWRPLGHQGWPA